MKIVSLLLGLVLGSSLVANNIQINNTAVITGTPDANSALISFDLSWENSWRVTSAPNNYDAVWIFVKFRAADGLWRHATLGGTGTVPTGTTVEIKEQRGAMIFRTEAGTGTFRVNGLELVWAFGADGESTAELLDVEVFGIEMVYVPEGPFSLGNNKGNAGDEETRGFSSANNTDFRVTSENAITQGTAAGQLNWNNAGGTGGNIPDAFPKGFAAFYVMKYEVSQKEWVAYFNTLTPNQQSNRDITSVTGKDSDGVVNRNGFSWSGAGPATTTLENVPISFVSRNDALSYLDWAALRPMTETEYEKVVRGPEAPSPNLFAWGTTNIKRGENYAVNDSGTANETVTTVTFSTTRGNAVHGDAVDNPGGFADPDGATHLAGNAGPLRSGIFAGSVIGANREQSGAAYYGAMEMSGNMAEGVISVTETAGRAFTGNHGDGSLSTNGLDDEGWPTGASIGFRGGWFSGDITYAMVADRSLMGSALNGDTTTNHTVGTGTNLRLNYYQMRGVRTQ